ncbi:unnamed protein product [Discosporangium mesarthrocarpum]
MKRGREEDQSPAATNIPRAPVETMGSSPMPSFNIERATMVVENVSLSLTAAEADILAVMLEAVEASGKQTIVRVAGGWVRDKHLGLENDDIDIALDNCTGVEFAEMVNAHLKDKGEVTHNVAVIEANPDQSKHLETARLKIMGVWVDLVNLRTETYSEDSRIPEAKFGTAEEDALRRDFTVNALFYNANTKEVEDFTGRGLDDMREGIIRTPLPPTVTFLDDPLRVLRAVRFAARFGFSMQKDLVAAAKDSRIQTALRSKVSRERVGTEVSGMLSGKMAQPALALSRLEELGLLESVFTLPPALTPPPPDGGYNWSRGVAAARAAARLMSKQANAAAQTEAGVAEGGGAMSGANACVRELFLSCVLVPLSGVGHVAKKGKVVPAAQFVLRESLKLKAKEAENVAEILKALPAFQTLADTLAAKKAGKGRDKADGGVSSLRVDCGVAVRQVKGLWGTCVAVNCALELSQREDGYGHTDASEEPPSNWEEVVTAKHEGLRSEIMSMGLGQAWTLRPLLGGNDIIKSLNVPKGPSVGKLMAQQVLWQLEHPEGTAEQSMEHLASLWSSKDF